MKKTQGIKYALAFVILLFIEVMIALYVRDSFVRPYVWDRLIVIAIYCFIRVFIPDKIRLLPLYIFIFAAGVEILQYFNIVEILGLKNNAFFSVIIGSVFDIKDIGCYAVGCFIIGGVEFLNNKYKTSIKWFYFTKPLRSLATSISSLVLSKNFYKSCVYTLFDDCLFLI